MSNAEDAPRAFDDDSAAMQEMPSLVIAVEQGALWQARRENPLAAGPNLVGIETAAGIAERLTRRVMETYADTAREHAVSVIGADLEVPSGLLGDALACKEVNRGVEL